MSIKIMLTACFVFLLSACGETKFNILDEKVVTLNELEGQWLFINYWAAWCKPCLHEIPELNAFTKDKRVEVFGFNYDKLDQDSLRAQIKKFNIGYLSILDDPAKLFDQPTPAGLPATMVISPTGNFVEWLYGPQTLETLSARLKSPH